MIVDRSVTAPSEPGAHPETALLLACARTRVDPEQCQPIQALLREDVDWTALIQLASNHKTLPLLYRSLATCCPDMVPADILEKLRTHFRANGRRNLTLGAELLKALRNLRDSGVCAVPFRGPLLAEVVYGDLALRSFHDLDILVQRQDVARAKDTLVSVGYRLVAPKRLPAPGHLSYEHAYGFRHAASGVRLDLHWEVTEGYFGFTLDPQLWDRLDTVPFMGRQVAGLRPEDLFLMLCVHSSKHGWVRLAWVCDVAELVRTQPTMDWERALWQARRHKAQRMVLLGLSLAGDLLGATLPEDIGQRVRADSAVRSLGLQVRERLFHEREATPATSETSRLFAFHLQLRESVGGKIRHWIRVAVFPTWQDWESLPLPGALFFLYFVLRPLRLLSKHVLRGRRG
jgi:hypothetical protein